MYTCPPSSEKCHKSMQKIHFSLKWVFRFQLLHVLHHWKGLSAVGSLLVSFMFRLWCRATIKEWTSFEAGVSPVQTSVSWRSTVPAGRNENPFWDRDNAMINNVFFFPFSPFQLSLCASWPGASLANMRQTPVSVSRFTRMHHCWTLKILVEGRPPEQSQTQRIKKIFSQNFVELSLNSLFDFFK